MNVKFLDPAFEEVDLAVERIDEVVIGQGPDCIIIPLAEAAAFADALKAWVEQQGDAA